MNEPATRNQVRFIESLGRDIGLGYSDLDEWLVEAGLQKRAVLSKGEASAAIDRLQQERDAVTLRGFVNEGRER